MTTLPKRFVQRLENFLLFLTILLLPTQLGKHLWPDFSYVYSIKIDYLSPTIYVWDLIVIALVLVFVWQGKYVNKPALNIGLFFILAHVLSLLPFLASPHLINIGIGLVRVEQFLVVILFGVYIASQDFKQLLQKIFWPMSISVVFIGILGILQFIFGQSIGFWLLGERAFSISTPAIAKFDYHSWQFLRPYSTFSHPNVLAAFILISLPILSLTIKSLRMQRMFYVSLAVGSLATILTVARTALIAGAVMLGFALNRRWLLIFIAILLLLSPLFYTRFSSIKDFDSLSLSRREQMNTVAMELFIQHPILGVGVNNFIPTAADDLLIGPNRFLQPVHSMFLLELSEVGVVGMFALSLIFISGVWSIAKSSNSSQQKHVLYLIWITIAFFGLFDHYWLSAHQGYRLLFLVWGISLANKSVMLNLSVSSEAAVFQHPPRLEDPETSSG